MLQTCTQIFREISCIDTLFPSAALQSSNVRFGNLLITLVVRTNAWYPNKRVTFNLSQQQRALLLEVYPHASTFKYAYVVFV